VLCLEFDNTCKLLAEQYPSDFIRWLLGVETRQIEILKTELTLEPIRADSVIFLRADNQILHIEFQTLAKSKPSIPFRALDYSVRLKRQYPYPVTQVVIFLQQTSDQIVFTEEYRDETTIHRYRAVRLWEQDSALFLKDKALLPLAPLTRTDSPRTLLAQVGERVARISDRDERQNIASCADILAGLRFEKDLIRQFLREDMMQESVTYQDILSKGKQQEALSMVTRLLNRRLGNIDDTLVDRLRGLSVEELETLGEALLDFTSVVDLTNWLAALR
jgi:predicted transposase YdaD